MSTSQPQSPQSPGSTTTSTTTNANTTLSARARAERLFEHLFYDPSLCVVCFARKRSYYPEYDQAVAEHLVGRNGTALESMGHRVDDEGGLMVNKATSDADPATYQEVVPPKTDQYGQILELPGPRTICQCGEIDFDLDENHRSKKQLYDGIENIAEHILKRDEIDEDDFNCEAAKEVIRQATKKDSLAGRDRRVLVGAIEFGLEKAHG